MLQKTASQQIHPTAVVDPKAELASGVVIGPGAVVGPEVVIGENTWIGPNAVLDGRLTLGRDNKVCLLYTSPSPRDKRQARMPSSA